MTDTLQDLLDRKEYLTHEMKFEIRMGNAGQAETLRKQLVETTDKIKQLKEQK